MGDPNDPVDVLRRHLPQQRVEERRAARGRGHGDPRPAVRAGGCRSRRAAHRGSLRGGHPPAGRDHDRLHDRSVRQAHAARRHRRDRLRDGQAGRDPGVGGGPRGLGPRWRARRSREPDRPLESTAAERPPNGALAICRVCPEHSAGPPLALLRAGRAVRTGSRGRARRGTRGPWRTRGAHWPASGPSGSRPGSRGTWRSPRGAGGPSTGGAPR